MGSNRLKTTGLLAGGLLFLTTLALAPPEGMGVEAWRVVGVGALMAVWWMTEALPIPATSLVPLALFPVLGIADMPDAAGPYANPLIYLFLGGFLIAEAVQQSGLHRRLALFVLSRRGDSAGGVVAGFMVATAGLSMWVSNTATALMMLPIGISVVELVTEPAPVGSSGARSFGTLLMLSIAYAASVGGLGTLIGTPPNTFMAGFLEESYGISIGFAEWMLVGIPLVLIGLPIVYVVLVRFVYPPEFESIPGGRLLFSGVLQEMGPMSTREMRVSAVFCVVAASWVVRPLIAPLVPGLTDAGIAIGGAIILFAIPAGRFSGERLLNWRHAARLPWGVLILFGGGLSLAAQIGDSGLSSWIGTALAGLSAVPLVVLILLFTASVIFMTELTSNTATAAAFLPVVGSVGVALTGEPLLFVVPATIAASCAFMLPVATPPNAVVYGSGYVTIPEMARAGLYLNLVFVVVITLAAFLLPLAGLG